MMQKGRRRLLGLGMGTPIAGAGPARALLESQSGWPVARIGPACLAVQRIECRVCSEHCKVGAIRFRLAVGQAANPSIDAASCTACGACALACPAGAIEIEPSGMEARPA